ncbi:TetR/AcrR family transcriptional regulator [Ectothiorhodospiraceae bacterium WFHF3C12]|nr:TetR/AcrR family transcriptional regulator [Ectothiorhodospiraceae bacterium WFHF3C12]
MSSTTAANRERYHHGDLRRALLSAAGALLEEGGAAALSLREAARRSGVSRTAPYRHFPDKEALLAALAAEGFRQLSASWRRAEADGGDADARLQAVAADYVAFAREHPARFRLMFGDFIQDKDAYPELQQAARESYRLLQSAVAERLSQPDSEGCNVNLGAIGSWVMVHGMANLLIDNKLQGLEDESAQRRLVTALSRIFITGLTELTRENSDCLGVPECGPNIRDGAGDPT